MKGRDGMHISAIDLLVYMSTDFGVVSQAGYYNYSLVALARMWKEKVLYTDLVYRALT